MYDIPDHPVIRNMEATGHPEGKAEIEILCPICGSTSDTFYKNQDGEVVGCDDCLTKVEPWECESEL